LDPEARRAQLVALGLKMLSTRPLDKVAIDDIAAEAGISRGLLFHYFPTKRDYHVAVARAAAQDLLDARTCWSAPRWASGCAPTSRRSSTT
jgi:AcrR family transcriptional regulator